MNYKNMSYISGVIIFVSFVIFFGSVLWLSGERIISAKEYKVYFKFSDVVGLKDRSPVFMRGYRIGWTKEVQFEKDAVLVRVDVKRRFRIPIDSQVEINTLNFIGEKAITITPGSSDQYLTPRSILAGQNKDIMNTAKSILIALKARVEDGSLDKAVSEVTQTIATSHDLVRKLDDKVNQIDVASYNQQIREIGLAAQSLRETASKAQNDLNKFTANGSTSLQNLDRALLQFTELSAALTQIAQHMERGEGTAGEILQNKEYIQNLNTTVIELKLLIEDIKNNPKKYINLSIF